MARHHRALLNYILSLHPDPVEADDIIQETSINIFRHFGDYESDRPFLPWAFRFAYFEVKRHRRAKARDRLVLSDELVELMAIERADAHDELEEKCRRLQGCVARLPASDRDLLAWRYEAGQTIREMAEGMKMPVKRLYKRLEHLRLILHRCMIAG